jgi:hypothetical protein
MDTPSFDVSVKGEMPRRQRKSAHPDVEEEVLRNRNDLGGIVDVLVAHDLGIGLAGSPAVGNASVCAPGATLGQASFGRYASLQDTCFGKTHRAGSNHRRKVFDMFERGDGEDAVVSPCRGHVPKGG